MRIISFITAAIVAVALYALILERDRVLEFAGRAPAAEAPQDAAAADTPVIATEATDIQAVPVVAMHSTAQQAQDLVVVRGRTEAARSVDIKAETSGRIISEPLRKGAFVTAGDTLCQIDPGTRETTLAQARAQYAEAQARLPEARASLQGAEAALDEAQINYNATTRLRETGYASETAAAAVQSALRQAQAAVEGARAGLEAAQTGVASAEAAVAAAEKEIERLTITAPFGGLLESDAAELGALLQAGSLCATVIQLDPIKLVGFVAETEVGKIATGAQAGARLATGEEVTGSVSFLGRSADSATRTFRVEVEIPNPDLAIRDGQTVEMVLASGTVAAHLLPQSALTLDDDGRLGVRVVETGNMARFYPVKLLRDTVQGVWVTGLPDQADVITIGQDYVIDGVPVVPSFGGGDSE